MSIEEIKALFPLKGQLTQEILDNSNTMDIYSCNGANTLKQSLGDIGENVVTWGAWFGIINEYSTKDFKIGTLEDLDFMYATEPQEVTFILI